MTISSTTSKLGAERRGTRNSDLNAPRKVLTGIVTQKCVPDGTSTVTAMTPAHVLSAMSQATKSLPSKKWTFLPSWQNAESVLQLTRRIDQSGWGQAASNQPRSHPKETSQRQSLSLLISSTSPLYHCKCPKVPPTRCIKQPRPPKNRYHGGSQLNQEVQARGYHQQSPMQKKGQKQQSKKPAMRQR